MNKYDSAHRWSEELLRVGMVCAAAHASLEPWCKVVGEYLTELAFQEESKEEGERLLAHIKVLLDIVPQLWITCGRAEAALRSFIG